MRLKTLIQNDFIHITYNYMLQNMILIHITYTTHINANLNT